MLYFLIVKNCLVRLWPGFPEVILMNRFRKIVILSIVAIAVVVTFMMKEKPQETQIITEEIPVLLDLSVDT